ncbi:unnamed protein product [Prorocentrum cordatum]|uniref:RanBP2-type domain-containing protein n=1 Tax=Prorocentrum cordatum TaxID=2364126 RepID=A0ABN9WPZ4_9DINO|nr:unnamed protein product [Polarella glacialis]
MVDLFADSLDLPTLRPTTEDLFTLRAKTETLVDGVTSAAPARGDADACGGVEPEDGGSAMLTDETSEADLGTFQVPVIPGLTAADVVRVGRSIHQAQQLLRSGSITGFQRSPEGGFVAQVSGSTPGISYSVRVPFTVAPRVMCLSCWAGAPASCAALAKLAGPMGPPTRPPGWAEPAGRRRRSRRAGRRTPAAADAPAGLGEAPPAAADAPAGLGEAPPAAASPAGTDAALAVGAGLAASEAAGWSCEACTFRNGPAAAVCEMCDNPRGAAGMPSEQAMRPSTPFASHWGALGAPEAAPRGRGRGRGRGLAVEPAPPACADHALREGALSAGGAIAPAGADPCGAAAARGAPPPCAWHREPTAPRQHAAAAAEPEEDVDDWLNDGGAPRAQGALILPLAPL